MWSIKKSLAGDLLKLSDEEFAHLVNEAFVKEDFKNDLAYKIENAVQNGFDYLRGFLPNGHDYINDRELAGRRLLPPKIEASYLRASYPLSYIHSNNFVASRIALIG